MTERPGGWYRAAGDPPDTVRYWDGSQWSTEAVDIADLAQPSGAAGTGRLKAAVTRGGVGFGVLLLNVVGWLLWGTLLAAGYWLSDVVYDAGIWPIGSMLRLVLLLGVIGWIVHALYLVVMLVMVVWFTFFGSDE